VESLDVLINNAGVARYDDLTDPAVLEEHLRVNLFGLYLVSQTFLPLLTRSRGALVNILSVNALAPLALIPAYSASKAAAFSLTQSLRMLPAERGVTVHAVLTGPVDTDMTRGLDIPKAAPESVARAIFRRGGKRARRNLPGSPVAVHRAELGRWPGQVTRTPVRGANATAARNLELRDLRQTKKENDHE
jgi:NAD(P)-dependent dehydrogenase (short-subunit alcohol dehydrogenase family)